MHKNHSNNYHSDNGVTSGGNNQINGFDAPYYSPTKSFTTKTTASTSPSIRSTQNSRFTSSIDSPKLSSAISLSPNYKNGASTFPITHTTNNSAVISVANTANHTKTTNTVHSVHDITFGCSRTIPIPWNNSNTSASLLQV